MSCLNLLVPVTPLVQGSYLELCNIYAILSISSQGVILKYFSHFSFYPIKQQNTVLLLTLIQYLPLLWPITFSARPTCIAIMIVL